MTTTVAQHWTKQVEAIRALPQDGPRVLLWDAHSEEAGHGPVAAGVLHAPAELNLDWLAFMLRDLLQSALGDDSIGVVVADQRDDGAGDAAAWRQRGVAEPNQPYRFCVHHGEEGGIEDVDWLCPSCYPDAETSPAAAVDDFDDEDQDDEPDPELLNELESLRGELDPEEDESEPDGYTAVLVPADETRPCTRVTLPHLDTGAYWSELGRHVGGSPNAAQYDRDALVYVEHDSARTSARNKRLTRYIWGHSEASAQNQTNPDNPSYWLHGDAVVIGADSRNDPLDVPRRIEAHFRINEP